MNEINIHPAASGAGYSALLQSVADVLRKARGQVARAVGHIQLQAYRQIGRYIVEYEQQGRERTAYGEEILGRLSKDLTLRFGRGFNRNTLQYMRRSYIAYPNCTTLSCKLSWIHYIEILKAEEPFEISFYEKQCERENWSVRELKRQMKSMLFHRIALNKDKEQVLALAAEGMKAQRPEDILRDPYVLEFVGLPEVPPGGIANRNCSHGRSRLSLGSAVPGGQARKGKAFLVLAYPMWMEYR